MKKKKTISIKILNCKLNLVKKAKLILVFLYFISQGKFLDTIHFRTMIIVMSELFKNVQSFVRIKNKKKTGVRRHSRTLGQYGQFMT